MFKLFQRVIACLIITSFLFPDIARCMDESKDLPDSSFIKPLLDTEKFKDDESEAPKLNALPRWTHLASDLASDDMHEVDPRTIVPEEVEGFARHIQSRAQKKSLTCREGIVLLLGLALSVPATAAVYYIVEDTLKRWTNNQTIIDGIRGTLTASAALGLSSLSTATFREWAAEDPSDENVYLPVSTRLRFSAWSKKLLATLVCAFFTVPLIDDWGRKAILSHHSNDIADIMIISLTVVLGLPALRPLFRMIEKSTTHSLQKNDPSPERDRLLLRCEAAMNSLPGWTKQTVAGVENCLDITTVRGIANDLARLGNIDDSQKRKIDALAKKSHWHKGVIGTAFIISLLSLASEWQTQYILAFNLFDTNGGEADFISNKTAAAFNATLICLFTLFPHIIGIRNALGDKQTTKASEHPFGLRALALLLSTVVAGTFTTQTILTTLELTDPWPSEWRITGASCLGFTLFTYLSDAFFRSIKAPLSAGVALFRRCSKLPMSGSDIKRFKQAQRAAIARAPSALLAELCKPYDDIESAKSAAAFQSSSAPMRSSIPPQSIWRCCQRKELVRRMSKNIQLSEASSLPQYVEDGTLNQLPPVNGTAKPSFCGKVASCMRSVGTDIKRMFFCCSQQADSSDDQLLDSQQFEHIHHEGNEDFDADPYVLSDED